MVTTGQQAGFLTGPLYTVYKALTTARLAERLEAELGIVVLPVFWIASEDHDWAEVDHANLLAGDDQVRRVQLPSGDPHPVPIAARTLDEGVIPVLDDAAHAVGGVAFSGSYITLFRDAYRPGVGMADAFATMLSALLAPFDLLLTDASEPALKAASLPVLEAELLRSERHERVLAERSAALREAGYAVQVPVLEGATNLFYHGAAGRERLYRRGDGFRGHESGVRLEWEEARRQLVSDPGRFSPNVFLRPVVESAVFPTLAYVGGPGEIGYFGQLNALFPEFGLEPPVVVPRVSAVLVEPAIERALGRLGIPLGELARPRHELAGRIARAAMSPEVKAALERLGESVASGYRELIEAADAGAPLAGALGRLRNEALALVGESERRVVRAIKLRETQRLAQLDRVRSHLFPGGEPQERVLNVVPFLARHGPGLLEEIKAAIPMEWSVPVS